MPRVTRIFIIGLMLALLLYAGVRMASAADRIGVVAVFPIENLSAGSVPTEDLRQFLVGRLVSEGIRVLSDADLDAFMTRHRVRYAAGIDPATAQALAQETGVNAVLVASFEMSSVTAPPKVSLMARLVSTSGAPAVIWADDAGMAGDDAPGLFGLGLVNDYPELLTRALNHVSDSLLAFLKTGEIKKDLKGASKFRPKMVYRELKTQPGTTYSVAVVPFFNLSERRNAGEILASLFMRHLYPFQQFRVIDTGVIREQLLNARIIMDGGLSVTDAETVAALIDADFVLGGRVMRYEDYEGPGGATRVEFSALLIERKTRKVVWSSDSYNEGRDGVHFFERGITRTAHEMATQMVRLTAEMIAGRER